MISKQVEKVEGRRIASHFGRAAAVIGVSAPVVLLGGSAFAATPDPAALATSLADTAGGTMLTTLTSVLPVLVPFLASLWAIGFVWKKIGLGRKKSVV